jgi:hypothetical protein
MAIPTLKVLASLLQMHGPGATIQSDHQGIDALLSDIRGQISNEGVVPSAPGVASRPGTTELAYFRRGFLRGAGAGFRRGGFLRV